MTNYTGALNKGIVSYHFNVFDNMAMIQKTVLSNNLEIIVEQNNFTIEYARRCWKALKAKGFNEKASK